MKGRAWIWGASLIVLHLASAGCNAPQQPCASMDGCGSAIINQSFNTTPSKDLDILFLMDNSPGADIASYALAGAIPRFIQKIEDAGADYHIGFATSDVGSYVAPGQPWSIS